MSAYRQHGEEDKVLTAGFLEKRARSKDKLWNRVLSASGDLLLFVSENNQSEADSGLNGN